MYGKKHVTKSDHGKPRHIKSPHKDKRVFSNTAQMTEKVNTMSAASPMRGGIRL